VQDMILTIFLIQKRNKQGVRTLHDTKNIIIKHTSDVEQVIGLEADMHSSKLFRVKNI